MEWMSLAGAEKLAEWAHDGQTDKLGVPYIEHVRAVARGLEPLNNDLGIAGFLHDIVEDTAATFEDLEMWRVPPRALRAIQAVTNDPLPKTATADERFEAYEKKLHDIATDRDATLVKIADNAHNTLPDRVVALEKTVSEEKRDRMARKYQRAREILWPAVNRHEVRIILKYVNPSLLSQV